MSLFYLTQDRVGARSGGGRVSGDEFGALSSLGDEVRLVDSSTVSPCDDPFESDERFCRLLEQYVADSGAPRIAHVYAGCFTTTVQFLKSKGTKVTYTCDAHNPDLSMEEARSCGYDYNLRHMVDRNLRDLYVRGYRTADTVVVPSSHSQEIMKKFGCERIVLIPHSVDPFPPLEIPRIFTVGYLGASGPDKGLRYLLEAWKSLGLRDSRILFAGDNYGFLLDYWRKTGGCNVHLLGPVGKLEDFFRRVSVYVQPSVTEGFGIPVLEAMAFGRPVIVSRGAGAADVVNVEGLEKFGLHVPARDPKSIAEAIMFYKKNEDKIREHGKNAHLCSKSYTPELIRERYVNLWKQL